MKIFAMMSLIILGSICQAETETELLRRLKKAPAEKLEKNKNTWLYKSARAGYDSIIDWLLEEGALIYESNALHAAIRHNRISTLHKFVNLGVDVDNPNNEKLSGIQTAAMFSNKEMFAEVLRLTDNINYRCSSGATALALADNFANYDHVEAILQLPNVDVKSTYYSLHFKDGVATKIDDRDLLSQCKDKTGKLIKQYIIR